MTALLSRKQVEELAAQNPIAALARCNEVLTRPNVARDSKRDAWARLAARIEAKMPKTETAIAKQEPVKATIVKQSKPSKPAKAEKGNWQIDGTEGSRIVPYTRKAVAGLFNGQAVSLSDDTWRYLTRPFNRGRPIQAGGIDQPERDLADYYDSIGHSPHPASVAGCGDHTLLAMALDGDAAPRLNGRS